MALRYDAIVIGSGQSGPSLAARMSQEGWRVALVERKWLGGTGVNTGGIPTKTLLASARMAHMVRRAADFGVVVDGPVRVDMKRVKARMEAIRAQTSCGLKNWLEGLPNIDLYCGQAVFEGPSQVRVAGQLLESGRIFINVGARPTVPPLPGVEEAGVLTSSEILELEELPAHLVVVGGGYIGLEMAQIFRRFGAQVTVMEAGERLLAQEDEEVGRMVQTILEGEDIHFVLNSHCVGFFRKDGQIEARYEGAAGAGAVSGSHLLLAVGRTPNTHDLGLEKAGVATSPEGFIQVDGALKTSVEGIWAIGDVNGRGFSTHTSYNDFEIVAANLFGQEARRVEERIPCYGLFIDPPLGRVGMTEREARQACDCLLIGQRAMSRVGRARERSETQGFIKVLVDGKTGQLLGGAILGIEGDEAIHCLLDMMYAKVPYTRAQKAVHIHPTVSELIPTVLGELHPA